MRYDIRRAVSVAAVMLICGAAAAQDESEPRRAVKHAAKRAALVAVAQNDPGYWERGSPTGYQYSNAYSISLHVKSIAKSEVVVKKIIEEAGGSAHGDGDRYSSSRGLRGKGPAQRFYQYEVAAGAADRVNKRLIALGELQSFSKFRQGRPETMAEVETKIEQISAEMSENQEELARMPIARALLNRTLRRLQQSKSAYDAVKDKVGLYVTIFSDEDPETVLPPKNKTEAEGAVKGNLGAIRSALSIYYGDQEGLYPTDFAQLTSGGNYLARIPSLEVAGHGRSSEVRNLAKVRDQKDLESQLKDTGQWLYVADPTSPLSGTVVVDCRHSDSRGTPWYKY